MVDASVQRRRDRADLMILADAEEGPDQVSGLDWPTAAGGENEAGVLPGCAQDLSISCLLRLTGHERSPRHKWDGQVAISSTCLDRPGLQGPANALELLAHVELASGQVDVALAQA